MLQVTDRSERDEDWFPAITTGVSYFDPDLEVVLSAQYYYNPLGYADSAALGPARRCLAVGAGGGESGGQGADNPSRAPTPCPDLAPQSVDLLFFGQHYGGASASWNNIADTDLSASLFWLGNLSDGSGVVRPSLSYQLLKYATVTLGASLGYAATPDAAEYPQRVAFTLGVSLGVGSF